MNIRSIDKHKANSDPESVVFGALRPLQSVNFFIVGCPVQGIKVEFDSVGRHI